MKISISGPGGCGKDLAAKLIAKHFGLQYKHSTSYTAAEFVLQQFAKDGYVFESKDACYEQRRDYREDWAKYIEKYNQYNKAQLYIDHLATGQDIATGIRKEIEIKACKHFGVFDLYIWIDRQEFNSTDTTQEYGPEECDITIINDTEEGLEGRIENLATAFHPLNFG